MGQVAQRHSENELKNWIQTRGIKTFLRCRISLMYWTTCSSSHNNCYPCYRLLCHWPRANFNVRLVFNNKKQGEKSSLEINNANSGKFVILMFWNTINDNYETFSSGLSIFNAFIWSTIKMLWKLSDVSIFSKNFLRKNNEAICLFSLPLTESQWYNWLIHATLGHTVEYSNPTLTVRI